MKMPDVEGLSENINPLRKNVSILFINNRLQFFHKLWKNLRKENLPQLVEKIIF